MPNARKLYVITKPETGEDGQPFALCAKCFETWGGKDKVMWRVIGEQTAEPCHYCHFEGLLKESVDKTVDRVFDSAMAVLTPDHPMTEREYELADRALNRTGQDLIDAVTKSLEESLVSGFKRRGYTDEQCQEILEDYRRRCAEAEAQIPKPW